MILAMSGRLPTKQSMVFPLQLLKTEIPRRAASFLSYPDKNSLGVRAKVNLIQGQFIQMVHMWVVLPQKSMSLKR